MKYQVFDDVFILVSGKATRVKIYGIIALEIEKFSKKFEYRYLVEERGNPPEAWMWKIEKEVFLSKEELISSL